MAFERSTRIAAMSAAIAIAGAALPARALEVSYLYSVSNTNGVLPLSGVSLAYDAETSETFATGEGLVRVFNDAGMEVYAFGTDVRAGTPSSVVTLEGGDLVAISYLEGRQQLVRCNFRGEFKATLTLSGIPADFGAFSPDALRAANGNLFLADRGAMRVVVARPDGSFVAGYDLAALVEVEDAKRADFGIRGFNVDREGNVLFTVQPLFKAFIVSPDGKVRSFGVKGSAPGKFNVVAGIAADDEGNLYVADILKSAVLVFDKELRFVREFGYRGRKPHNLAAPEEILFANGKLYVAQNGRRGVSVFKVDWKS